MLGDHDAVDLPYAVQDFGVRLNITKKNQGVTRHD
jgi:hypothetical protein